MSHRVKPDQLRRIKTRHVVVRPDLTRAQAVKAAMRKSPGDARGFTYDPKTGRATLT